MPRDIARKPRFIYPTIATSLSLASISALTELLFWRILPQADDQGRLSGHPAQLKALACPMRDDFTTDNIPGLLSELAETGLIILYSNPTPIIQITNWWHYQGGMRRIYPSKYPPPEEWRDRITGSGGQTPTNADNVPLSREEVPTNADKFPIDADNVPPKSIYQSSQYISKSVNQNQSVGGQTPIDDGQTPPTPDFTKFKDSEADLTDFLTTTLKKHVSAAAARSGCATGQEIPAALRVNTAMPVLQKCWSDIFGGSKMPQGVFDGARKALKEYPVELVSKAFAKGLKYKGGKHKSWKYFQAILEEESRKGGRGPPR